MKTIKHFVLSSVFLFLISHFTFGQTPSLGKVSSFVLFSANGAVSNTGISHFTGNIGTNNGSNTSFGNIDGVMHSNDTLTADCAVDLLNTYNELNDAIPTFFPSSLLGNGDTLVGGVYYVSEAASLNLNLYLDAEGNANKIFIFQLQGSLSTNADAEIKLINGAKACNVFWIVKGLVSMASGTSMKGTIIANNAAIIMYSGVTLEGRAFSTTGAITVDGVNAKIPIGCGSPYLTGPVAPILGTTECYAIFSTSGDITNTNTTIVTGDIGTNTGLTTGFDSLLVNGVIHTIPDTSTANCAVDLLTVYNYLNEIPYDIELLYPVEFGKNLVLTPHTYILKAATVLTDSLFLDAQGNENAVFIIKIDGALSTNTYSKILLINGAKAENVYWKINGALDINEYSIFNGTIICNNGAISTKFGVKHDGRIFTTTGSIAIAANTIISPLDCSETAIYPIAVYNTKEAILIYPNPFNNYININFNNDVTFEFAEIQIFNVLGEKIVSQSINKQQTTIETSNIPLGIYFYKIISKNEVIQSGKLISQ